MSESFTNWKIMQSLEYHATFEICCLKMQLKLDQNQQNQKFAMIFHVYVESVTNWFKKVHEVNEKFKIFSY